MFYFIFLFFVEVSPFHSIHHYFSLSFMFHNSMLHHVSSLEHILADNLFASPKKSAGDPLTVFSAASVEADENTTSTTSSSLNMTSLKSCSLQKPRYIHKNTLTLMTSIKGRWLIITCSFQVVFRAWNRWHIGGKSERGQQWRDLTIF